MRKTKKVESFGFAFASCSSSLGRKAAELDEPRFLGVQFQIEFAESILQIPLKPLGIRLILETGHNVIGIPDHNHMATCMSFTPLLGPQVEHIVQVDVRQQRRNTATLWRTFLHLRVLTFFQYTSVKPFLDMANHTLVSNAVLNELDQPFVIDGIERPHDTLPTSKRPRQSKSSGPTIP